MYVTLCARFSSNGIMSLQTVTRAAESDLQPGQVYEVLADASNIPKWAPVFADTIEGVSDSHHRVNKNGEDFDLEILVHRSAGTVDYIRDMPNGNRGGAYIRVTPHPRAGSVVTM